jgi:hypothetical protein
MSTSAEIFLGTIIFTIFLAVLNIEYNVGRIADSLDRLLKHEQYGGWDPDKK